MIADDVLPRTAPMGSQKFSYFKFADEQFFTLPDTAVGRKSAVNEVDFKGTEVNDQTKDYGLSHAIANSDQQGAVKVVSPEARVAEWLSNLVALGREVRVANAVFNASAYGSNAQILTSADQFDNDTADIKRMILDALSKPLMRPNIGVIGEHDWNNLRQNPSVVSSLLGNSGTKGIASRRQVADLFELDDIYVGRGRINTAKPGQTMALNAAWSGGLALIYQDSVSVQMIDSENTAPAATFGFTAQFGDKVGMRKEDDDIGLRGGVRVKAGESLKEVISGAAFGYFFGNVSGS
jgi:hypothetical protein